MSERNANREIEKEYILIIQEENSKTYNKKEKRPTPTNPLQSKKKDRHNMKKPGYHDGPNITSSAADLMKSWTMLQTVIFDTNVFETL